MTKSAEDLLHNCLFFTANSLARSISRLAEEEFGRLGLVPSHAFLLMLAVDQPGITQKELAAQLHLAPSTVSRFVDVLAQRGLLEKRVFGKQTQAWPTEMGQAQLAPIREAWMAIHRRYSAILGEEEGRTLAQLTDEAQRKLEEG